MIRNEETLQVQLVAHTEMVDPLRDDADFLPCSAARASFGNEDKTGLDYEKDVGLMNYLADHRHMTPYEYQHATFLVECPLFIRSQIHRHRTFSYNEISRRYTSEQIEFWVPAEWRKQAKKNKQASDGVIEDRDELDMIYLDTVEQCWAAYMQLLDRGVCREQARAILPQGLLTRFYMGGNLRNWQHFLSLRLGEDAQPEVRRVAERIAERLRELWPESCEALGI